jgi:serralysin
LGHTGNYDGSADYSTDALFANDGWPTTIMSYFDQQESTYFADQGFSRVYLATPMIADIAAIQLLYGGSTTTRTGDTTYGFNSNAGRNSFDATLHPNVAYTVFDSGGTDTLNYSGFSANQIITLAAGSFSNVGGFTGNVSIAVGTTIENALGGGGYDVLRGNSANNMLTGGAGNDQLYGNGGNDVLVGGGGSDALTGGAGGDAFEGSASSLSGDTIFDFAADDLIIIADAQLATFSFSLSGSTLTYSGGSLTLHGVEGELVAEAADGGGVQLRLATPAGPNVTGTVGDDTLTGGTGDDTLDGFAGADTMYGELGNDTYIVDNVGDRAIESDRRDGPGEVLRLLRIGNERREADTNRDCGDQRHRECAHRRDHRQWRSEPAQRWGRQRRTKGPRRSRQAERWHGQR